MQDTERKGRPITQVIQTRRDLHGGNTGIGPDIIVGYNRGYRVSWKSPMGEFPKEHFPANLDAWSADHCVDSRVVPGILVSNRKITMESPALYDVTAAVLALYGISPLPEMLGKNCLEV
jgi:predicted AlkP superfamily phosphohydrolase/phosphomutase